jgi:Tfp pilus assembly protein PilV
MRSTELERGRVIDLAGRSATERGFTLVETTIAMLIMMIAGLGVVSLFVYSIRYNSGGNDRAVAISIAQQQLEQLRSVPFTDSTLNVTNSVTANYAVATVRDGRTYRVRKIVTGSNNDTSGNPTFKTITIRVDPTGPGWAGFPVILRTVRSTTTQGTY